MFLRQGEVTNTSTRGRGSHAICTAVVKDVPSNAASAKIMAVANSGWTPQAAAFESKKAS